MMQLLMSGSKDLERIISSGERTMKNIERKAVQMDIARALSQITEKPYQELYEWFNSEYKFSRSISQAEYDILQAFSHCGFRTMDFRLMDEFRKLGYFKDFHRSETISDILESCEVHE